MKKSKRLFLLITLCLASTTASLQAQQGANSRGPDPAQRAEMQTARMKEELSLSNNQSEKVKEINLKYANKMKEAREASRNGDRGNMRETMTALRQEQSEELKSVLTAEQFEKWQQLQSEGPGGRNGNSPPNGNN